MAGYVSDVSNKDKDQIVVHYPPTFNPNWRPQPYASDLAAALGIRPGEFVVGYLGSFFYFSGLPEVLKSIAQTADNKKSVKLLLVGGGEQDAELRAVVNSHGLDGKVVFTGFVRFDEIPKYLSLFDLGINPMHPSDVSDFSLPNKVIQYLAAGMPVVSTALK
jgi:glycosyltransferase involved in cell wall biosynthesis